MKRIGLLAVLVGLTAGAAAGPTNTAPTTTSGLSACQKKRVDACGCHHVYGVRHCHPTRKTNHCEAPVSGVEPQRSQKATSVHL